MRFRALPTLFVVVVTALGAALGTAAAQDASDPTSSTGGVAVESAAIGALRIVPAGRQVFDIATGETVLPDGGVILAAESSIRLEAPRIRYLEGRYVEAEDARVEAEVGTVTAASVRFDLETGVIEFRGEGLGSAVAAAGGTSEEPGEAPPDGDSEPSGGTTTTDAAGSDASDEGRSAGGVRLASDELRLDASSLTYWTVEGVAVLEGPVVGANPDLDAARVLVDVASGVALLESPYAFRGGLVTLEAAEPGSRLQLDPVEVDGEATFDARTDVSSEVLERFAPWLAPVAGE